MSSRFKPVRTTNRRVPATLHGPFRSTAERRAAERCAADAQQARAIAQVLKAVRA